MHRSYRPLFAALALLASAGASFAAGDQPAMISQAAANKILARGKFVAVASKEEVPKIWWQAMSLADMSDIGGPFAAGCVGNEPHRRLILAAVAEPYAIEVTEQGGIAYITDFKIFAHRGKAVKMIYSEMVREPRIAEIRKALRRP